MYILYIYICVYVFLVNKKASEGYDFLLLYNPISYLKMYYK